MRRLIGIVLLIMAFTMSEAQTNSVFDIARKGTLSEIKVLFNTNPDLVNSYNENKHSPLILACYRGNIEVAKFLVKNVKDINYCSDMGTALMAATYKNQTELVKALLENNANPNIADLNGTTALLLAVQFKNLGLVKILLDYKADKTIKDKKGKTAFEYAVFSGNEEMINQLK